MGFLWDLSSDEKIVKITKMGVDNLALVFSPSFLRNPIMTTTTPMAVMTKEALVGSSAHESQFCKKLIEKLGPSSSLKLQRPKKVSLPFGPLLFEREEYYIPYYNEYFFVEKGT